MRSRAHLDDRSEAAPPRPLYDVDFALWIEAQVAALRAGDMAALDLPNLIEELEGLTKRDERALGAQLKRIMVHLPEAAPSAAAGEPEPGGPDRERPRGNRRHPRAEPRTAPHPARPDGYPRAVFQAARDTRLPPETFPSAPPFSLDEVLGDD